MASSSAYAYLGKEAHSDLEALVKKSQKELPYSTRSFEKLLRKIEPTDYRYCRYIVKDETMAEDACQNTLMRLFQSLNKFEGRSKFMTWLYRVTFNECLKVIDKSRIKHSEKVMTSIDDISEEAEPYINAGYLQDGIHLKSILSGLKEDEVSVVMLKHVDGYTFEEIAEIMEMTVSAVKMKLYRLYAKVDSREKAALEKAGVPL